MAETNFDQIILVDKPAGISSFGVVAKVRYWLKCQAGHKVKVGHCGTLDPFATGLLILVTGKFTRRAVEFSGLDKEYIATIKLGATSSTGDPEGEITDQPVRVMVSEIVREKILKNLDKEIPHGVAVCVEKMKSRADLGNMVDIDIVIYCEKMSHKGIIIGKGGYMLKKIGTNARYDMEKLLDAKVNLKLWVKVKEDWRNSLYSLKDFGYDQKNFD